jgi:signal transduction histidine kinase
VIEHLRPVGSVDNGELAPTLRRHVELWSRRAGVPAELLVNADRDLPAEPLLTVATEALTNVARHSGARHVRLVLQAADGQVQLTIADDGHGFDQAVTVPGQGLRGMAERLAQRRGELDVRSGPDGTTLTASYPEA